MHCLEELVLHVCIIVCTFCMMMEASKKYPVINELSEDLFNLKYKAYNLMEEMSKRKKLVFGLDFSKMILGPFCISAGCSECQESRLNCKHKDNNQYVTSFEMYVIS
jgi:hypothetical protein